MLCSAERAAGRMCALPSCGATACADDDHGGGIKLKRCARCRLTAYCGPAHQAQD
jgi:hypothetical protein